MLIASSGSVLQCRGGLSEVLTELTQRCANTLMHEQGGVRSETREWRVGREWVGKFDKASFGSTSHFCMQRGEARLF